MSIALGTLVVSQPRERTRKLKMTITEPRKITREELYAQVWSKPVTHLAKEWGLSDVGLAKLCRRHCVPLPYRGFWARKDAGQTPKPIPLPPSRRGIPAVVHLDPRVPAPPKPADPEIEKAIATDSVFSALDVVPEDLRGCSSYVAKARAALRSADIDDFGRAAPRRGTDCPIRINVSRSLQSRALRIAQAIIAGATRRGYPMRVAEKRHSVEFVLRGNEFGFGIEEPSKRFDNPPDPKDPHRYYRRYRYEPSGRLVLTLLHNGYPIQNWRDSERQKVEACVPDFFKTLTVSAIEQERSDAEWKAKQDRWQAAERLRSEYAAASKQVLELKERLDDADGLRRLLTRFETEQIDMSKPVGEFASWRDWLLELIRVTEPFTEIRSGTICLGRKIAGGPLTASLGPTDPNQ